MLMDFSKAEVAGADCVCLHLRRLASADACQLQH